MKISIGEIIQAKDDIRVLKEVAEWCEGDSSNMMSKKYPALSRDFEGALFRLEDLVKRLCSTEVTIKG